MVSVLYMIVFYRKKLFHICLLIYERILFYDTFIKKIVLCFIMFSISSIPASGRVFFHCKA